MSEGCDDLVRARNDEEVSTTVTKIINQLASIHINPSPTLSIENLSNIKVHHVTAAFQAPLSEVCDPQFATHYTGVPAASATHKALPQLNPP